MYNIILICTRHQELGKCNSTELLKIVEQIAPDVIFEELSNLNFFKAYGEKSLTTLETKAVIGYLKKHKAKHIPIDTYAAPKRYEEEWEEMCRKLIRKGTNYEAFRWRELLMHQQAKEREQGFKFLNSQENDHIFEEMNVIKNKILEEINKERYWLIDQLEADVMSGRETEMIANVYNFCKENAFEKAVMFIGSGHRKSIMGVIKEFERREPKQLTWNFFQG